MTTREARSTRAGPTSDDATQVITPSKPFARAPTILRDDTSPARPWALVLVLAIAAGAWLRFMQLPSQILVDDEWHAIHALLRLGFAQIVTNFGTADYSIPLTLYDRFLALHGGLSEWEMHVPMLVAGVALLVLAPAMLRRLVDAPARAAWVVLMALSPLLVYLTRTARPYALTCLLAFVAVLAFRGWRRRGSRARAALYVATTFLAGWLHLVSLAFTLLPFAWYGGRALRAPWPRRGIDLRALALLGVVTLLPLAIALAPPLVNAAGQLAEKSGTDSVTLDSVYRTLLMLAGSASPLWLAVALVLGVVGVQRMHARDRDFVGLVTTIVIGSAVAIAAMRPAWIHHPGVFARYLLPALPFLLLFVAEGVAAVLSPLRTRRIAPLALVAGGALLFFIGPMPAWFYWPNQFIGHARFQFDYDPAHNPYVLEIPDEPVPAFYRALAERPPGSLTLIEAPWRLESNFDPFPWYQQVHRQYVKIGLVTPVCGVRDFGEFPPDEPRLHFRWFVHLSRILDGESFGARYLIMHRRAWKTPPDAYVEWPDVDACLPLIEKRLGAPAYRDERIVVFDLGAHAAAARSATHAAVR